MLLSGRWWLVEGFSGFIKLSPLCKAAGPNEKIGRVEYGFDGNRICYKSRKRTVWSILTKDTAFLKGTSYRFLNLPFCNTVSIQACVEKWKHESFNWKTCCLSKTVWGAYSSIFTASLTITLTLAPLTSKHFSPKWQYNQLKWNLKFTLFFRVPMSPLLMKFLQNLYHCLIPIWTLLG